MTTSTPDEVASAMSDPKGTREQKKDAMSDPKGTHEQGKPMSDPRRFRERGDPMSDPEGLVSGGARGGERGKKTMNPFGARNSDGAHAMEPAGAQAKEPALFTQRYTPDLPRRTSYGTDRHAS